MAVEVTEEIVQANPGASFEDLNEEQIKELLQRRTQELNEIRRIARKRGAKVSGGDRPGGTVARVISTNNAMARASYALEKATARYNETVAEHEQAVQAYLTAAGIDEVPDEVRKNMDEQAQRAVDNMKAAHQKISDRLKARAAQKNASTDSTESEAPDEAAEDDEE